MNQPVPASGTSARLVRGGVLLAASVAALALIFFLLTLCLRFVHPSDEILPVRAETGTATADLSGTAERFSASLAVSALSNLTEIEIPELQEPEEAEIVVETRYTIDDGALAGERPNPACYGSSADPDEVEAVIASAAELLDGQPTVWNRDLPFWKDTVTRWYCDDTILVLSWTELTGGALCYCSEVKVADPSQFRRALAGNSYGAGRQLLCSNMASAANAVLASNADFYSYRAEGINVFRGKLYRCWAGLENCFIDSRGNLLVTHRDELTTEEEARQYIKDHDVNFSISFGPILVEDGIPTTSYWYSIGQPDSVAARAVLAQMGECHYLVMNVNYTSISGLVPIVAEKHPITAYTMDGGQTGETILGGEILNEVVFHAERSVSDIIYFATAYPWEEEAEP